jgi:hypothetical protein
MMRGYLKVHLHDYRLPNAAPSPFLALTLVLGHFIPVYKAYHTPYIGRKLHGQRTSLDIMVKRKILGIKSHSFSREQSLYQLTNVI